MEQLSFSLTIPKPVTPGRVLKIKESPYVAWKGCDKEGLAAFTERLLVDLPQSTLKLRVTDNRTTMISVRRKQKNYHVSLHHMFLQAPPKTVKALAQYILRNDRKASTHLSLYIEQQKSFIRQETRRSAPVRIFLRGKCFDLGEIFDDLNARFFSSKISARITWGSQRSRGKRHHRSIKMGSYSVEDRLIRIHPALDREFVPFYFVQWIVYHEMLHEVHEMPVVGGRRRFHTHEFLQKEKDFPNYQRARAWERANLDRILFY